MATTPIQRANIFNISLKPEISEPETWDGKFGCPLCLFRGSDQGDLKKHYQSQEHQKAYFDAMKSPSSNSPFYDIHENETQQEYLTRVSFAYILGKIPSYCSVTEKYGTFWFSHALSSKNKNSLASRQKRGEVNLPSPQKLAHAFGKGSGHSLFFAYERTPFSRSFGSYMTFKSFWKNYWPLSDKEKRFHEQFLKGQPTREIFDIDSSELTEEEAKALNIPELFQKLRREFSPEEKLDFFIVHSCGKEKGKYKTSYHIVSTRTHYDIVELGKFCKEFVSFLEKRRDGVVLASLIDKQIYTKNRTIRVPWSCKCESNRRLLPIEEHKDKKPIDFFGTPLGYLWCGEYKEEEQEERKEFQGIVNPGDYEDILNDFVEQKLGGEFEIRKEGNQWRIQRNEGQSNECPFCEREHHKDNYKAYVAYDRLWVRCFRADRPAALTPPTKKGERKFRKKSVNSSLPPLQADFSYSSPTCRPIMFEQNKKCLAIQSAMGTGKTKALAFYLKLRPQLRVLVVTYRRTLAREMCEKLPGFVNYEDQQGGWLNAKKLVVQVDSLHRVFGKYDLLVFDEVTYTDSRLLCDVAQKTGCWKTFKQCVRNAKNVLLMDKNLNQTTIDLFEKLGAHCHVVRNEFKAHKDKKVQIHSGFLEFKEKLLEDLEKGTKICFASSSKKKLELLCREAKDRDFRILWYTGEGKSENVWLESWKNYDLVAYTPTISAGVSYEEEHFDKVYGYFSSRSCCAEEAEQMLFRVRNIAQKELVLAFDDRTSNCPTTKKGVIENLEAKDGTSFSLEGIKWDIACGTFVENARSKAFVEVTVRRNLSKVGISGVLTGLLEEQGMSIEYVNPVLSGNYLKGLREDQKYLEKTIKLEDAVKVAEAQPTTKQEFSFLCSRKEKTEEDICKCKKFMLSHVFEVEQQEITPEFVLEYSGQENIFRNQRLAFVGTKEEQKERLSSLIREKNADKTLMKNDERMHLSNRLEKIVYARRLFYWLGFKSVLEREKKSKEEMVWRLKKIREKVGKSKNFQVMLGKLPEEAYTVRWLNDSLRKLFGCAISRTTKHEKFEWELTFSSPWIYGQEVTPVAKKKAVAYIVPKVC
ncbi:putative helicase [Brazilian marseillevirus]|uniref:replication n=1 Tax=Brazilian marseillevirus TaxID=1813599 RepID=UPI000784D765|nr:replication [Brazilian marseillevirus]AMQ10679.1 putative helicase [Brazilian marseillevirus]